jgi:DNA helicase-2/ATP-dependent DNA helicase PcrA
MKHLEGLNQAQKEAVLHKDGPLLIVAGAGAGKTKTLTHRIINLIKEGVAPSQILAITFTNKAAKEMEERITTLLESERREAGLAYHEHPFVSTFHALGVQMVREYGEYFGIPRHFTILDRNDSLSLIKEALAEEGIDSKQFEPGRFLGVISRQKGDLVTAEEYAAGAGNEYFPKILSSVWLRYERLMKKQKALDFDDLILKPAKLLQENAEVRAVYQNRWHYVHIDEYQDTNESQYELSRLLAERHKNICVVGDADQNIYSWRGANIKNILNFEKDYPDARVVLLEENYRSTQNILAAANSVIKKNQERKEKNLFTKNREGEKISVFGAYDENEEARHVAEKAAELIERGVSPRDIAVLYRANFQSRVLEEAFLARDIPYQVLGVKFFERKEVKDVISYIKAALNPESFYDLKRVINVPPRGIGKATYAKVIAGNETGLSPAMRARVAEFKKLLAEIRENALHEKTSSLIKFIMEETRMEKVLKEGRTEEDQERLENLRELVTLATKYDALPPEDGVDKLLVDAALATDQDSLERDDNAVKLMTVHAAKGLEFRFVFITGLEQDLFPHHRFAPGENARDGEEEERRLFYVALTRAKEKLFLSHTALRTIFGAKQVNTPSEFLADIDDEFIEEETGDGNGEVLYTIVFD